MIREVAQQPPDLQYIRRRAAITFVPAIVLVLSVDLISRLFWIEDGRSKNDLMVFIILPAIRLYVMLLYSVTAMRMSPQSLACNCMWFNWSKSELKRLVLLPLGVLLIAALISLLRNVLQVPDRSTVILRSDVCTRALMTALLVQNVVIAPVLEEVFWRGCVQGILSTLLGVWAGILVQAVLFASTHITPPLGFVQILLIGILFGIWRHRRNTLLPLILMHAANNAFYVVLNWSP